MIHVYKQKYERSKPRDLYETKYLDLRDLKENIYHVYIYISKNINNQKGKFLKRNKFRNVSKQHDQTRAHPSKI